jgi:hypothetical protein
MWQSINLKFSPSARPAISRDRLAVLLGLMTLAIAGIVFFLSRGTTVLMPGPLSSAHGGIEKCSACHSKSGSSKVSWARGLTAGDPHADSKACLSCHKMPDTAFNAHGATLEVLQRSTERLSKTAALTPQPISARMQNVAFPTHEGVARDLTCATCHQEHQGVNFKISTISNEQCRSCHVVKFDSFDGNHPKFETYPFKQRTPIIYDHAGHFDKHYPDVAKKEPSKTIPATCSACHTSTKDKRVMAVLPFEKTCATCHLDQITGKERANGPKGVAFLTLPGLDVQSLKAKNAAIGEWPDASEAALTPFMKVMISRTEPGRDLLRTIASLNLQDLSAASNDEIKAVTALVWDIKALFHAMISGKASDVLGDLNMGGVTLSATLVADLTASLPRDVLISAQQQWLPNLAAEIDNQKQGRPARGWVPVTPNTNAAGSAPAIVPDQKTEATPSATADTPEDATEKTDTAEGSDSSDTSKSDETKEAGAVKRDPPACMVRVLGQCLVVKGQEAPQGSQQKPGDGTSQSSASTLPPAMRAGLMELAQATAPAAATAESAGTQNKQASSSDDLLFPTEAEQRDMKGVIKDAGQSAPPNAASGKSDGAAPGDAAISAPATTAPVISIESNVDPESWADYGGWYRQDFAIFYRPTGHKDKFLYSWLYLTGPQAPLGDAGPAAAVFDGLTGKDAQGSCTKCHSVDELPNKGRIVNFAQPSAESKQGRFTSFIHEPHFGNMGDRGCLSCHAIEKDRAYLKAYEQGNLQSFVSNFGSVKKELCQTCHNKTMARQDCLTCHKYHVNGVITPIMSTKLPTP